jgi:lysine-N-methylase
MMAALVTWNFVSAFGCPPMELPVFQNYDCHSCGYCCRNLVVNITPAELETIVRAGWLERFPGQQLFIEYRFRGRRLIRLAHRADGACVFLGGDGRCRLHAETGLATKPLACRLYPFVPTPGVGSIRLDLRFDCPSVAAGRGRSVRVHRAEILEHVRQVRAELGASPRWNGVLLDPDEFDALVGAFDECLTHRHLPLRARIQAAARLLDLLMSLRPRRVRGDRFRDLMRLLAAGAIDETGPEAAAVAPSLRTQRLFRQWLFLHAIADDPQELFCGRLERFRRSWKRYGQSRKFAAGAGDVPLLRPDWPTVRFEQIHAITPAGDDALEPLVRSLRVKLHAHAFAGPAYYGYDLLPGLAALLLLPALVGWFARLAAAGGGRDGLTPEDVIEGLRQASHTFGVSPVFARISERMRIRALAQPGVTIGLQALYGP